MPRPLLAEAGLDGGCEKYAGSDEEVRRHSVNRPGVARNVPKTATARAPPIWRLVLKTPLAVPV